MTIDNDNANLNDPKPPRIAIIGAGLTGLLTATLLERAFGAISITVFEKSRSVGRLATRYRTDEQSGKNWQWAFGAQFFTAKSAAFNQFIQPWLDTGLLQPWQAAVVNMTSAQNSNGKDQTITNKEQWDERHARYISTPKMTSWGRTLADQLQQTTIHFNTRVAPLNDDTKTSANKKTELFDNNGESLGMFDWVICTAPNVQAFDLMAGSGFSQQGSIMQPTMQACYTLMLGWDSSDKLPAVLAQAEPLWDVAYMQDAILDRIFIEHQKPGRDAVLPSVTIHARNDWSEQHVDDDSQDVQAKLVAVAKQALDWDENSKPSQIDCHRWRYAATVMEDNDKALGVLVDKEKQWIVSGDWCGQGNIESCYQMAAETIETISEYLNE